VDEMNKGLSREIVPYILLIISILYLSNLLPEIKIIAATPFVFIPKTYNTSNVEVSVFLIDNQVIVRANVTDSTASHPVRNATLNISNPNNLFNVYQRNMSQYGTITNGYTFEWNYTLNSTDVSGTYKVNVTGMDNASYSASNSTTFTVTAGLLAVNLTTPDPGLYTNANPARWSQYSLYNITANIICKNGNCGNVYGTVNYNSSSTNPNNDINTTIGATPFYITSNIRPISYASGTTGFGVIGYIPSGDNSIGYDDGYNNTNTYVQMYCTAIGTARVNYTYSIYPSSATLFVTQRCDVGDGDGSYCGVQIYNFTGNNWYKWLNTSTAVSTNATSLNTSSGLINSDGTVIISEFLNCSKSGEAPTLNFYDTYINQRGSLSCGSLNKDQSCQLNWTVNATGTIDSPYKIGVLFNSSYSSVTKNHTNNATVRISGGDLEVNLTNPDPGLYTNANPARWSQYSSYSITANITCKNGDCGNVYGTVRYNVSATNPDTNISIVEGATPFYITASDGTPTATQTKIQTGADPGYYSSIALDGNGKVHISLHDSGINLNLMYCNNTAGTWTCTNVETGGDVGSYSSIAIDSNDKVHISHQNGTGLDLRYCNNTAGTWTCTDVETGSSVGWYSSIAIDSNDKVHISHQNGTGLDLRYCNNTAGTWTCTDVETGGQVGYFSSIAIDSNDKIHISHWKYDDSDLRYCNNTAGTWTCTDVETGGDVGRYSSIAIDSNDKVHISHFNLTSMFMRYCYTNDFSTWNCQDISSSSNIPWTNGRAIAIKKGRLCDSTSSSPSVHISYYVSPLAYTIITRSPLSCGSLVKDQSCQLNWTVNTTGTIDSPYKIGVLFNSSYSSVTKNHTNNATVKISGGDLNVNLTNPDPGLYTNANPARWSQYSLYFINSTVKCESNYCGNVYGTVRYNASSANPDTAINTIEGSTPFYILNANNWLSEWIYRKSHLITNSTGADVNYTVQIIVVNATGTDSGNTVYINKTKSDFGDVRFTNSTGSLLDYWIENVTNGVNATFWVRIDGNLTSTNQTIYIYYGNNSATNLSSGKGTFPLFDDFDDASINTSLWETQTNSFILLSETGGQMKLQANAVGEWYYGGFRSLSSFGPGYAAMTNAYINHVNTMNSAGRFGFVNATVSWDLDINDATPFPPSIKTWYLYLTDDSRYIYSRNSSLYEVSISNDYTWGSTHTSDIRWTSNRVDFFLDSVSEGYTTDAANILNDSRRVGGMAAAGGNSGNTYWNFTWFAVRKYVYPEPSHDTWGSEVSFNTCGPLSKDQSCQLSWTVNVTGTIDSAYKIGVLFNSSYSSVTKNHTNNATVKISGGDLNVNLTNPDPGLYTNANPARWSQYSLYFINSTVKCESNYCGNVYGLVRYNASSTNPDTAINTTEGDQPFYIVDATPIGIETTAVETYSVVGQYSSIAIDSNDKVHISHQNVTFGDLRYCNNTLGTWTCTDVETGGSVGWYSSIAIDSNDKVHISHQNLTDYDLRYCNNTLGTWTCRDIETGGSVGWYSSIAIDSNDKVHISHGEYIDETHNDLRYCNNTAGTWTCRDIETGGDVGSFSSIAIDSNDKVHISHLDSTGDDLRYCNNTAGTWTCRDIETGGIVGYYSSIAIDSNDKVHISHYNFTGLDLRYCNNTAGTWTCRDIETGGDVGSFSSIAIDSNDKVHISHYDNTNKALRYCYTNDFSTWNCQGIGGDETAAWTNGRAIAIKKGRLCDSTSFSPYVHMSYYNDATDDLMYAKITRNPLSCGSLNKDQSCQLNWTVNTTGTIDSAYKIGVLFNSSYSSVTKNHTNNATVQIMGGDLEVNLTYPPIGIMSVNQNSTFNVNATINCKRSDCGNVYGVVRYNASATNPDTNISIVEGATPFYITRTGWCYQESANVSTSCGGLNTGVYEITTNGNNNLNNSIDGNWSTAGTAAIDNIDYLYVNYTKPTNAKSSSLWQIKMGNTTTLNISVPTNCWNENPLQFRVYSDVRVGTIGNAWYCWNGTDWFTLAVDTSSSYVYEEAMWWDFGGTCGSLSKDQSCQLSWTVNATGIPISEYKIGVLFNSSSTTVSQNHTDNATIRIIACIEDITLGWSTINFTVNPSTTGSSNPAPGNSNNIYNISNTGTCTLRVWIKGTDIQNTSLPSPNKILVGNLTWSNTTDEYGNSYQMTYDYVLLNSSLTPTVKNITTYYWLAVPAITTGRYNGTITVCMNTTQQTGGSVC
jgi:hypothetical protein